MGKFDGWLICSDFDGTVYVDREISDENCRAIRYFQEQGGRFTFASGRFIFMFDEFVDRIRPNAPVAGLNGSIIGDPCGSRLYYSGGVERDPAIKFAFECLERYSGVVSLLFYTPEELIKVKRGESVDAAELAAKLPLLLSKVVLIVTPETSNDIFADVTERTAGTYAVSRSWVRGVELNSPNDTKGNAVLRIKEFTGASHLVCVGDYENDIPMIKAADIGYAVGNAVPPLKAVADRVTVDCRDHALAHIIGELEKELAF